MGIWFLSSSIMNHVVYQEERQNYRNGSIINHESMMCVFIHYESIINEWWILNRQSSIISPWLLLCNCWSFVLVERCICVCGSWCGRLCPALWWKDRHIQSKEPWSSFTSHPTMDNACVCQSCDSRTVVVPKNCIDQALNCIRIVPYMYLISSCI